jgi:DUF438 domain-containing protein
MSELIGKKRDELKEVIKELHTGKSPEDVKKKFKKLINGVSAEEISSIEQELVDEGMSPFELQKLCDAHLEVFKESLHEETNLPEGHPIKILMEEHNHFLKVMKNLKELIDNYSKNGNPEKIGKIFKNLKDSEKHYLREENVLFPYLEKRGITQPPRIMWMEHDLIRDIKKGIYAVYNSDNIGVSKEKQKELYRKVSLLFDTLSSHFFKENNILFPSAINVIKEVEWEKIRDEFDKIGYCCVLPGKFHKSSENNKENTDFDFDLINLPTGNFTIGELEGIFNTLPVDITFIDKDDAVRFYNETKDKIFIRTESIIGRKVQLCHPQKSVHIVNKILEEFKSGKRDKAEFWIDFEDKFIFIRYFPITDKKGEYFGCIEVTQDITEIKKLEGEKRLME